MRSNEEQFELLGQIITDIRIQKQRSATEWKKGWCVSYWKGSAGLQKVPGKQYSFRKTWMKRFCQDCFAVPLTRLPLTFSKAWLPREIPGSYEGCRDTPARRHLLMKTLQSPATRQVLLSCLFSGHGGCWLHGLQVPSDQVCNQFKSQVLLSVAWALH